MSEMIKRVATAIAVADGHNVMWPAYADHARGAIEAMREPTDAMIADAMAPYVYGNDETMNCAFKSTISGYWRAMIDTALSLPKGEL